MSLQLSCARCLTPVARLDTVRFPVVPGATYCRGCSPGAQVAALLASG